jgi:hypothetical protein
MTSSATPAKAGVAEDVMDVVRDAHRRGDAVADRELLVGVVDVRRLCDTAGRDRSEAVAGVVGVAVGRAGARVAGDVAGRVIGQRADCGRPAHHRVNAVGVRRVLQCIRSRDPAGGQRLAGAIADAVVRPRRVAVGPRRTRQPVGGGVGEHLIVRRRDQVVDTGGLR